LNSQADDQFLGFGIANEIIIRIGQASTVTVRPTSAIRRYVTQNEDALTAARQLHVDAVVEGSFQRVDDRIRFTTHLLRTSDGASIWAESVDSPATDLLDLQKDVADKIAARLRLRLTDRRMALRRTSNPQAHQYFSKGLYYFGDRGFDSRVSLQTAIDLFRSAIELDPKNADARAHLAYAYAWSDWFYEENLEFIERAKQEIRAAEQLDPALASVRLVRSLLLCNQRGCEVEAATRELLQAQRIDPNVAHIELAAMYRRMGLEEKEREAEEAALLVDPTAAIQKEATIFGRYSSARPDEGLEASHRFFKRGPSAWYYIEKMMPDQAAALVARGDVNAGDGAICQAYIAAALIPALQGRYREAEDQIPVLLKNARGYVILYYVVARVYALAGKNEEAIKWLKHWAERFHPSYPNYARDPFLDRLRDYKPFVEFMADMKDRWRRYQREFG
jgi:TolB-like protein